MTAEDAGTAALRNENADSDDLEEVSFEVVAPPIEVNPLLPPNCIILTICMYID